MTSKLILLILWLFSSQSIFLCSLISASWLALLNISRVLCAGLTVFCILLTFLFYYELFCRWNLFQYKRVHSLEKCASGLVMKYCILLISLYCIENNYFLRTYDVKETVISRSPADLCNHKQHSTYFLWEQNLCTTSKVHKIQYH